eukprot:scaffold576_cov260-Pinguiococcus_pyrenoidosus.AAC.57
MVRGARSFHGASACQRVFQLYLTAATSAQSALGHQKTREVPDAPVQETPEVNSPDLSFPVFLPPSKEVFQKPIIERDRS